MCIRVGYVPGSHQLLSLETPDTPIETFIRNVLTLPGAVFQNYKRESRGVCLHQMGISVFKGSKERLS